MTFPLSSPYHNQKSKVFNLFYSYDQNIITESDCRLGVWLYGKIVKDESPIFIL